MYKSVLIHCINHCWLLTYNQLNNYNFLLLKIEKNTKKSLKIIKKLRHQTLKTLRNA